MKEKINEELAEELDEAKDMTDDKLEKAPWYMIESEKNFC